MAATAGLGVLLETTAAQQQLRRHAAPARTPAQVISKATITNAAGASKNDDANNHTHTTSSLGCAFTCLSSSASRAPTMSSVPPASSFLQRCFLCHRELADGRDIYIYRGDRAFCSEECRCRHILVEDDDDCARVLAAAADRSRRHRGQAVAGGFAF